MLVRYAYDLDSHSIDIAQAREWFDVNADGAIDETPGSPERGAPPPTPPIFHVGNLYLQTVNVSLASDSFTLKSVQGDSRRLELGIGSRVPNFTYHDFDGAPHKLSDVKAKYTLLDFWATWCVPCVTDLPFKKAAYDRFHERGFEILGMNGDADTAKPKALLDKLHIFWAEAKPDPELLDKEFRITSWPTLLLVDEHGTIVSTSQQDHLPLSGKDLEKTLETLLP
jgi:thiol-disulfide isomerase/thioredoxin